jgi:hypothetical protein
VTIIITAATAALVTLIVKVAIALHTAHQKVLEARAERAAQWFRALHTIPIPRPPSPFTPQGKGLRPMARRALDMGWVA